MILPLILLDPGFLKNGSGQLCSFKQCRKTEGLSLLLDVEDWKMRQHGNKEDGVTTAWQILALPLNFC